MMDSIYQDFVDKKSISSYKLVLIGLYYVNTQKTDRAQEILKELVSRQNKEEGYIDSDSTSITRS